MLDKAELVKKKFKRHSLKKISIKILNDDNAKLAHAGSKCSMSFFIGKQDTSSSSVILVY